MKYLIIPVLLISVLSCKNKIEGEGQSSNNSTFDSINKQVNNSYVNGVVDSSFQDFLSEFSSSQEFQLARVKFPLNVKFLDIEDNEEILTISIHDWEHEDFMDTVGIKTKIVDAYSQQVEVKDKDAIVKLRGIDNGIRIDYKFHQINGRWFLIEIFNAST